MALFENMLGSGESLFKDIDVLDFSYHPKPIKHREVQQRYMANCIKPLFQNRNGKNLFVYGIPGIGKTLACKQLIAELEETTDEVVNSTLKRMLAIKRTSNRFPAGVSASKMIS